MSIEGFYGPSGLAGTVERPAHPPASRPNAAGGGFGDALTRAATAALAPEAEAEQAVASFVQGAGGQLHETLLAVDRAEISLKFLMSVRNRVIEAYREIMRMGI